MYKLIFLLLFFFCFQTDEKTPAGAQKLIDNYPQITKYQDNFIYFADGSSQIYDDKIDKTTQQLLDNPDLEDQFAYNYVKLSETTKTDAGRIRNEAFFKKIYGNSKKNVEKNLKEIVWCPKLVNQKIKVTTVNKINEKLLKISDELVKLPQFKKYITNIGGTFTWRNIAGTNRLSMHSFGMTIDINTKYSNYWQWDCKCKTEETKLKYKNIIPLEIVKIFAKHGFIWGGNWQHYDSMHFEYRPELLN